MRFYVGDEVALRVQVVEYLGDGQYVVSYDDDDELVVMDLDLENLND